MICECREERPPEMPQEEKPATQAYGKGRTQQAAEGRRERLRQGQGSNSDSDLLRLDPTTRGRSRKRRNAKCDEGTPDDCCGPDVGILNLRQRLIGPLPYLVDPGDTSPRSSAASRNTA